MYPVLFTLPGVGFKILVPFLVVLGIGLLVRVGLQRLRARQAAPTEVPFTDRVTDGMVVLIVGIALFVLCAPVDVPSGGVFQRLGYALVAFGRGTVSSTVWTSPWQSLPVYSYGVMLGLAMVLGWRVTLYLAAKQGLERHAMAEAYLVTAGAALVGSRVLYVITNPHEFMDPTTGNFAFDRVFAARTGGLVAYGGFLGGLCGALFFFRGKSARFFWPWADAAAPSLSQGLALTRIGCWLYGCDFGRPLRATAPAWLRTLGTFPRWSDRHGSPAWVQHRVHGFASDPIRCVDWHHGEIHDGLCRLGSGSDASVPVHPTQLYESALGVVLTLVVWSVWRRRRFEGEVLLTLAIGYGVSRALLETLRDDRERGMYGPLSTSQWIGIVTAVVCAVLWIVRFRRSRVAVPA